MMFDVLRPFNIKSHQDCIGLNVLGFNDTSTIVGHFVSSPREREKRNKMKERDREERGTGMKVKKQK